MLVASSCDWEPLKFTSYIDTNKAQCPPDDGQWLVGWLVGWLMGHRMVTTCTSVAVAAAAAVGIAITCA